MTKKKLICHEENMIDYRKQYNEYMDEIGHNHTPDAYIATIQADLEEELDELLAQGIEADIKERRKKLDPIIKDLEKKLREFNRLYVYRFRRWKLCPEEFPGLEPEIQEGVSESGKKWKCYDYPNSVMPSVRKIALNRVHRKQYEHLTNEMIEPEVTLNSLRRQIKMYEKVNGKLHTKKGANNENAIKDS